MKVFTSKGEIKTKQVTSVSNLSDIGDVDATPPGDGEVLAFSTSSGNWEPSAAGSGTMNNVVDDTTPQLGGDLDLNGQNVTATSASVIADANITIDGGTI